ncbi:MAG: efflux RND transporter permease subunit [Myxococcales bacterium]|nr:efflux RND transporter permease subunit [Myxococcales bacterium]MDD9971575.1 efflux RND transporter permease subunit [Myxococcales bacterium]
MYAFFIRRPVFAAVISIVITLAGAISITQLPVAWYPALSSPQVRVTSYFTGADAETVESTVTSVLEDAINGVEGMRYIASNSTSDGMSRITVTFERERDIDIATVDVQNRVATAMGRLPAQVRQIGVDVRQSTSSIIMGMGVYSEDERYDSLFISNYIDRYIRDELRRLEGVGLVRIFGERRYAMRLWLDPVRLVANNLSADAVVDALREQNVQAAVGQLGSPPSPVEQPLQVALRSNSLLSSEEDFENLIIRDDEHGLLRFRDVGRVELGAENYRMFLRFNEHDAAGIGVYQLPNANALDVERRVKKRMEELAKAFPPGLTYKIGFNPTENVSESIDEVVWTLAGTIVLVILVIYLFLQQVRTTLIPAITIPVSLLGTFTFVRVFDFSINTLTLFGLTLATGLVVDDAIVVVENIERHARLHKQGRFMAALSGTAEVFSAVIATSLVLIAVFVPASMFPGTTGVLYRQFALTIACSIGLSSLVALTLAPALAALLLSTGEPSHRGLFGQFNRGLAWFTSFYQRTATATLRRRGSLLTLFCLLIAAAAVLAVKIPQGFVPAEDQGFFITRINAPPGTSLGTTGKIVKRIEAVLHSEEDVKVTFAVVGFSFDGTASNRATIFTRMLPRDQRHGEEHTSKAVLERLSEKLSAIPDALVVAFEPPPIRGVGFVGGVEMRLLDRANLGLQALAEAGRKVMDAAEARDDIGKAMSSFSAADPQLFLEVDRERARMLEVPIDNVYSTLQVMLGSRYVNDFQMLNRTYPVYVQAGPEYRDTPDDIGALYVQAKNGAAVPLSNLVRPVETTAAQNIPHFNLFRSATVNARPAPGQSSGEAIKVMRGLAESLPEGIDYQFSGLTLDEIMAGQQGVLLFALGLMFTFLVLSAQYESFSLPVVILSAVPMGVLGALGLQVLRGFNNDAFCQVGLLMLIGLASKNAILIVEFAQQLRSENPKLSAADAAVEAATIRLRPILMTSFAFILSMLPLVFAEGAGSAARRSLGTTVGGGMLVSTLLNLYFIPLAYVLTIRVTEGIRRRLGAKLAEPPAVTGSPTG